MSPISPTVPSAIFKVLSSTSGLSSPSSLVAYLIRLPRFELWRFQRSQIENHLALGSLAILSASSVGPLILRRRVSETHQFVSSLFYVLVNAVFHISIRVCRTPTHGATLIENTDDLLLQFSHVYYLPLIACWCSITAQTRSLLRG